MISTSFGEQALEFAVSRVTFDLAIPLSPVMLQKPISKLSELSG